jgi:uncharacterized protein (DUF1015 family)
MAIFKPFKAFRPPYDKAKDVASLPYDVMNSDEAREVKERNPNSFIRIGKPEVDLDNGVDLYSGTVYEKGRDNLQDFIKQGLLKEDEKESFYLYAQTMDGRTQFGLVGCASVEDYHNDVIKKHEFTRKKKEEDRCQHVRVTNAHTGPIFLTFRDNDTLTKVIEKVSSLKPETDIVAEDGVGHTVWPITDSGDIEIISSAFGSLDNLYVADGHHRSAAAAIVGKERAEAAGSVTGEEEFNFFLAVAFPASELAIMDYNRVVKDLNGLTEEEFFERIEDDFSRGEAESQVKPAEKGEFGMYMDGKWHVLYADEELYDSSEPKKNLDVYVLQEYLLNKILGIEDPRTDERIDFIGGIRGLDELERRVDSGEMKVAFSLFPTTIDELMDIADSGEVMPPKSTWFEPKLRDGLFVHFLD